MRPSPKRPWLALGLLAGLVAGCGGQDKPPAPEPEPEPPARTFAPVSGTVTVGEEPLEQGFIQIIPTGPTGGPISTGTVDGGKIAQVTVQDKPEQAGAVVGPVAVIIQVPEGAETPIPEKYTQRDTSPLEFEVAEGGATWEIRLQTLAEVNPPPPRVLTMRDGRKIARISGTVTVDGVPLSSGTIRLVPKRPTTGRPATGTIENGEFKELSCYVRYPGAGAIVGQHHVEIRPSPGSRVEIPQKYRNYSTSPITVEITDADEQEPLKIEISTRE